MRLLALIMSCAELRERFHAEAQSPHLEMIEYFAGVAVVTAAFKAQQLPSLSYDIIKDPIFNDLLSPPGFAYALHAACRVREGGLAMLAPVCSSWVWMCMASSKRTRARPMGDLRLPWVRDANRMVSRVVLILYILSARRVLWILEQPSSSMLQYHVRFQEFMKKVQLYRVFTHLGAFAGAQTRKPTWLYSQHQHVGNLARKVAPGSFSLALVKRGANGAVTGNENLKGSQAYPEGFGKAIYDMHAYSRERLADDAKRLRTKDLQPVTVADIIHPDIVGEDM